MFEIRSPHERDARSPGELLGHRLADELGEAYDDSGRTTDSSTGANGGGVAGANGRPRTVSLEAQTTRPTPRSAAAAKTLYVDRAFVRNVSPAGTQLGRRDRREMDDRIGPGDHVVDLPEVGEVGPDAQAVGTAVMGQVHVEHVVVVLAQVAHHPAPCLAAAARHDDPHPSTSGANELRTVPFGR